MTFYYELDIDKIEEGYPPYIYDKNYDYFLSALSKRVFKLDKNTLIVVSGDQTFYSLDPKETTFIVLSARPRPKKLSSYFDPGHA